LKMRKTIALTALAHRIADIVIDREERTSLAIGIHAPWGEGKTSVLNLIRQRLLESEIICLEFNPWRYPGEDKLLKNFFFDLAKTIGVSLETTSEKAGRAIKKYSKGLAWMGFIGIKADEALAALSELVPDAEIEELKARIEEQLGKATKKVVVIIDDIDRLDITEIQALFRIVKLSANFPNVVYILSFDEKRVADAIKNLYGDNIEAGANFLEKIIQISLPLPPASSRALLELTVRDINHALDSAEINLTDAQEEQFTKLFQNAFKDRIKTPRKIKRMSNALNFAFPLMRDEVDNLDLLFIEYIKSFYPLLYNAIRENGELILDFTQGDEILGHKNVDLHNVISDNLTKALADVPLHERKGIDTLLIDFFPGLSELALFSQSLNTSPRNNERIQRISFRNYFWRYFSYGVEPHDVSDNTVKNFTEALPNMSVTDAANSISAFLDDSNRFSILINKLRRYEDVLEVETSEKLAFVISSLSDRFPETHPDDRIYGMGIMSDCARLIIRLTDRLPKGKRSNVLQEIVRETPSITFAFEVAHMMRAYGEELKTMDSTFAVIPYGIEREINQLVVDRIAEFEKTTRFSKDHLYYVQDIYLFWFNQGADSLQNHLEKCFELDPSSVIEFLAGLMQANLDANRKFSYYTNRNLNYLATIGTLLDLDLVVRRLKEIYLHRETQTDDKDRKRKLAVEFIRAYDEKFSTSND